MKTYQVEVVYETSKHARIIIDAESERAAIDKARQLEAAMFDDEAISKQTLWKARRQRESFMDIIRSVFGVG